MASSDAASNTPLLAGLSEARAATQGAAAQARWKPQLRGSTTYDARVSFHWMGLFLNVVSIASTAVLITKAEYLAAERAHTLYALVACTIVAVLGYFVEANRSSSLQYLQGGPETSKTSIRWMQYMQKVAPVITMKVTCYHTELQRYRDSDGNDSVRETTAITHTASENMEFHAWADYSGALPSLYHASNLREVRGGSRTFLKERQKSARTKTSKLHFNLCRPWMFSCPNFIFSKLELVEVLRLLTTRLTAIFETWRNNFRPNMKGEIRTCRTNRLCTFLACKKIYWSRMETQIVWWIWLRTGWPRCFSCPGHTAYGWKPSALRYIGNSRKWYLAMMISRRASRSQHRKLAMQLRSPYHPYFNIIMGE